MSSPVLPVRLYPGQVSIYGAASLTGITSDKMQFGLINQMADNIPNSVSVGDSVMFRLDKSETIYYGSNTYFLINQNDIKLIEIVVT